MRTIFCIALCISTPLYADWVMFSDSEDTYIYNDKTGEVYVRYKKGAENYRDVFVKMPRGMQPNELSKNNASTNSENLQNLQSVQNVQNMQLQSLQKSQEMLNNALEF